MQFTWPDVEIAAVCIQDFLYSSAENMEKETEKDPKCIHLVPNKTFWSFNTVLIVSINQNCSLETDWTEVHIATN